MKTLHIVLYLLSHLPNFICKVKFRAPAPSCCWVWFTSSFLVFFLRWFSHLVMSRLSRNLALLSPLNTENLSICFFRTYSMCLSTSLIDLKPWRNWIRIASRASSYFTFVSCCTFFELGLRASFAERMALYRWWACESFENAMMVESKCSKLVLDFHQNDLTLALALEEVF